MLTESQAADLEELAAFIDGRLSGERKARVEERLLRDEDYYEVFVETVEFKEHDQKSEQKGGEVVKGPAAWWRSPRVVGVASLAAAALLVVVVGLRLPSQNPSAADWVAHLNVADIVTREYWNDPGWSRTRGTEDCDGAEDCAFPLGVRSVDLQVALVAGQRQDAKGAAARLKNLVVGADFVWLTGSYANLQDQVEGTDFDELLAQAVQVEESLRESFVDPLNSRRFALGQWAQASRLAALTRDAEALASILRDMPEVRPGDGITSQVERLENLRESPEPDFDDATATLERLIKTLAG